MKRYLPFGIVGIVAVLTLGSAVLLYRGKRLPEVTVSKALTATADPVDEGHVLGPVEARVTLEEFGDYECPPCGRIASVINQLERDYRPHLRVVFRNFPFANHPHAETAALAAEAAGMQGRFWEMHDLLYREQSAWSSAPDARLLFERYAGMIGLESVRFKQDMDSEAAKARIAADQQRGNSLGVISTPSIFINNQPLSRSSLNITGMRAAIDAAMTAKPTG